MNSVDRLEKVSERLRKLHREAKSDLEREVIEKTAAGLAALMQDGKLDALMENTTRAAYARAVELR